MWRWSCHIKRGHVQNRVFSTYVEVIPGYDYISNDGYSFLHVCGGDPKLAPCFKWIVKFSPRMWRWSRLLEFRKRQVIVFSTYVEVILTCEFSIPARSCFLHVCGGDPLQSVLNVVERWFSPRMWRWSQFYWRHVIRNSVFSTYVEVILLTCVDVKDRKGFLHVCGGDPNNGESYIVPFEFSPRMWRWSWMGETTMKNRIVFSTYVEVILQGIAYEDYFKRFLHVCGGDPIGINSSLCITQFSPRMWRWSWWLESYIY